MDVGYFTNIILSSIRLAIMVLKHKSKDGKQNSERKNSSSFHTLVFTMSRSGRLPLEEGQESPQSEVHRAGKAE